MLEQYLSTEEITHFVEGIARMEYHLLLGAGASLGAKNNIGLIPNAKDLTDQIVSDFSIATGGYDLELKAAYEHIEGMTDRLGRSRDEYFAAKFTGCIPSWQSLIADFRWNKIWSLNIDDVIELAYSQKKVTKQHIKTIDWTDYYSETDRAKNELQLVHLHGYAPYLQASRSKLVFSILEYLQATSKAHAWHRIFGDEFLQRPFIVVGAKLTDEYDLADVIRRGNNARNLTGRPSVILLKEIPPFMKGNFKKWGLLPVEGTAESFFKELKPHVEESEKSLIGISTPVNKDALIFLNQFRWLRADDSSLGNKNRDFYLGDDPEWSDIQQNKDAVFDVALRITQNIGEIERLTTAVQRVYCISGPPGSGKTASAMRIAREITKIGYDVFWFKGETRPKLDGIKWCFNTFKKVAIFMDGLADFANDIGRLLVEAADNNLKVLLVGTERIQRMQLIYQSIGAEFLVTNGFSTAVLTDDDIKRLLEKLEESKRLGKITRYSPQEKIKYFRSYAKRQLLVGMSELEGGKGFPVRIRNEHDGIVRDEFKKVYELSCVTYSIGYSLPIAIASTACGVSAMELTDSINVGGELSGVMRIDGIGLKPRHRVIASLLIDKVLNNQVRYELTLLLAKTLSPYITTRTISERTIPYRIVRHLMDEQLIHEWVGAIRSRDWYEALVPMYNWNARFWEQRALLEARLGHFPRARSYAEEALRIQRHSFTLNTLGSILTKMATEYLNPQSREGYEVFWEGVKALRGARDYREDDSIHSYTTFFSRVIAFAKQAYVSQNQIIAEDLRKEFNAWMSVAKHTTLFSHPESKKQLDSYLSAMLELIAVQT